MTAAAPVAGAPAPEAPVTNAPVIEAPVAEAPDREAPVREGPAHEGPVREGRVREGPARKGPAREGPAHEAPARGAPVDDARDGVDMFLIFTSAVLGVTGAVALVALINTWLVLGLAVGLHLLMTTVVCLTIAKVMSSRRPAGALRQ